MQMHADAATTPSDPHQQTDYKLRLEAMCILQHITYRR